MSPETRRATYRSRALGVELDLPGPTLGLPEVSDPAGGRRATIEMASGPDRIAGAAGTRRLFDRKAGDGGDPLLTLDVHERQGYRIWARGFGSFCISPDGSHVHCSPETEDPSVWQRYLIGQVLPFVSILQGVEGVHGSAVALDGQVVALVGGSGAGKTSVAARLLLRGATFVTDDVLALERDGSRVLVHPGPGILGVRHAEFAKLSAVEIPRLGQRLAENEKEVVFGMERAPHALPLAAIYFIQRDTEAQEVTFERSEAASPLLGSTFNTVLSGPDRLERMLDVFAQVSKSAQVFSAAVPPQVDAAALAAAVEGHPATGNEVRAA